MDGAGLVSLRGVRAAGIIVLATCLAGAVAESPPPRELPHPLHVSTSQLAVDTSTVWLRIRMFKDDLELALAARAGLPTLRLEPTAPHDSLFMDYFGEAFGLRLNDVEVTGVIESSGEDLDSGEGELQTWWYQVRFDGSGPIRGIEIRNEILYDQFDDQRNIVRVLHVPTETRRSLYFAAPDRDWAEVTWKGPRD